MVALKRPPRILIFAITMGANYQFELNSIEPPFLGHTNLFLGGVTVIGYVVCTYLPGKTVNNGAIKN